VFSKKCNFCNENSYSASLVSPWICPYCNQDISRLELNLFEGRDIGKSIDNRFNRFLTIVKNDNPNSRKAIKSLKSYKL